MQSSVLRYPKADRFIRIHESLMVACRNNACAAALVTFFEGWHNFKVQQREYTELYNQMADLAEAPRVIDCSGWQYHTNEQLEAGVMIYKIDTINKALELLESLEFISTDVPDRLRQLYRTGRTRWFLLRADKLNEWFDNYERTLRPAKPRQITPRRETQKPTYKAATEVTEIFNYWARRTNQLKAIPNADRLKLIGDRLREGFSVGDLCYAVEGNVSSEWHQGKNDRNKVYNGVELIFKNATKVEDFMRRAHSAGVSREDVVRLVDNPEEIAPAPKVKKFTPEERGKILYVLFPAIEAPTVDASSVPVRQLKAMGITAADLADMKGEAVDRAEGNLGVWSAKYEANWNAILNLL